jgi:hypothetical protein
MKTYFDVGNERFGSREAAVERVKTWNADTSVFHVHQVANTEVTRRNAKGKAFTELVRGSLDGVPRILSVRELPPIYVVSDTDVKPFRYQGPCGATRADAEAERAKRQSRVEKLAALTESDIREVYVPTLADILERDEDKVDGLQTEVKEASKELKRLKEQASSSVASALADLDRQAAVLKAEAAKIFGVEKAQERFDAAVEAFHEAIHFDELEEEVQEKLHEVHGLDCWPNSDCRGECTFEPDSDDVEEYLLEHAEEFEIEEEIADTETATEAAA